MARIISIALALSLASCVDDPTLGAEAPEDEYAYEESELSAPVFPTAHPRIYLPKHKARLQAALTANSAAASRFKQRVDQWVAGTTIWGFEAWNAALMGQLTNDPKYCTKAVGEIEKQVVAAEAKIASGAKPVVAENSYLAIGEVIGDLALVYDWCHTKVTAAQKARWFNYANQAIWNVWNPTLAKWGNQTHTWSGWSTNNPSNNYYYSFLRATMLVGLATRGEFPQGDQWVTQFRSAKIGTQLVPTFNTALVGGGSLEGTGYGVAMRRLYELYDFWYATTGEQISQLTTHTKTSLYAFMHQVTPTLDRIAPTGDHARDRAAPFFDYHRNYLQELAHLNPTDIASGRAKTMIAASNIPQMSQSFMYAYDFLYDNSAIVAKPLDGMNTAYHAKGIGHVYARSGWDTNATWINLIAGPYNESHAHQDQGSLLVFKGGWLAQDANLQSKSGIMQTVDTHGLVRIDSGGVPLKQQLNNVSKLTALHKGANYVHVAADVTPAYKNNSAVQMVHREVVFLPPNVVVVFDRVKTSAGTTQTWQLPTPVSPAISGNTATITSAGHSLKVTRVAPSAATMSVFNFASNASYTGGYRLDEKVSGGDNRYLHVLSLDGGATSVVAAGATGVTVNLASGGQATVTFNRDTTGATLKIGATTTNLTAVVDTLPY